MPTDNLADELTRSLASDDFDDVLLRLPAVQTDVERRLALASNASEREQILSEAMAWNRRWLNLARSLKGDLAARMRLVDLESNYAQPNDSGRLVDATG